MWGSGVLPISPPRKVQVLPTATSIYSTDKYGPLTPFLALALRLQAHLALLLKRPSPVTIIANTAARITPRFVVVTEVSIK